MNKEQTAAIALGTRRLDWTRLERVRGVWRAVASRETAWPDQPRADAEEDPQPGLSDEARSLLDGIPERVTLCIESAQAFFRCLQLPTTDPSEVTEMVAIQLDKVLPLPLEEMSLATETLCLDEVHTTVMACAMPAAVLSRAVQEVGLSQRRIVRIDIAALAVLRLLTETGEMLESGREVVLFDETTCVTLLVLEDGLPVLIRVTGPLDSSSGELIRAIRLSLVQAEVERGLTGLERVTLLTAHESAEALRRRLAEELGSAVRVLAPDGLGPVSRGAALRTTSRSGFDLMPNEWRVTLADRRFRTGLWRMVGAAAIVWALCVAVLFGGPAWFDRRAAQLEERLTALEPPARAVRDVQNRVRMILTYMDRQWSPLETLREICLLLPDGIELSSFRYRREDRRLSLQGSARSTPLVYEFKQRVDASALFGGSALVSGPTTNPRTRGADFELLVLFREETP